MGAVSFFNIMFKPYLQLHLKTFDSKKPQQFEYFSPSIGSPPKPSSLWYMFLSPRAEDGNASVSPILLQYLLYKESPHSDSFLNYY